LGALVLLAWMPSTLLEPGFKLSFAAVAAIFVGLPRARRALEGYPVPPAAVDALAVAVVCGLATAPFMLLHFDRAPVYTVPANLLAFAPLPFVLALGLLAALVDPVAPGAAAALAWGAGWAAAWIELVARVVASLPAAQIGSRATLVAAAVAAAAVLGGRHLRRSRVGGRLPAVAAAAAALVAVGWWWARPVPAWERPPGLRVTFLDVGQGDAVLLETASARVLVDEGPPEADVAGQLRGLGIGSLSALVLTHPERDHVGGAAAILRRLRVGAVLDPELEATGPDHDEAMAAAAERHVPVRLVRTGSELRAGGLLIRALWPSDEGLASENPNLNAVVLLVSYGETDVLLPADAESDVTARLPLGEVEVLKVAHHGSEDPGLDEELRTLRPRVAVISCGRDNEYGHPRPETLAALQAVPGLALYRTDEDGSIVIESDGRSLRVRTAK
jgi:competence protein ComEC